MFYVELLHSLKQILLQSMFNLYYECRLIICQLQISYVVMIYVFSCFFVKLSDLFFRHTFMCMHVCILCACMFAHPSVVFL